MTLFFIGLITGMLISLVCYFTAYIILKEKEINYGEIEKIM